MVVISVLAQVALALCIRAPAVAPARTPSSVGVIVITSPARSHPNTEIIWSAIESLELLEGLSSAPITIVCDGCRPTALLDPAHAERLADRISVDPCLFSKRGIVSDEVAAAYDNFQVQLEKEAAAHPTLAARLSLLRLDSHHGFALAVREGLLSCCRAGLKHALVMQHDRAFIRRLRLSTLQGILDHFETQRACRYVGFPSGTSKLLASRARDATTLNWLIRCHIVA